LGWLVECQVGKQGSFWVCWAVLLGPGHILSVDGGFCARDVEDLGLETVAICLCPHVGRFDVPVCIECFEVGYRELANSSCSVEYGCEASIDCGVERF
jgi:hypothetical protein